MEASYYQVVSHLWRDLMLHPSFIMITVLFLTFKYFVYPIYLSPLAQIPNAHPLAPITSLWMHWRRYTGREVQTAYRAFQEKGNFVRLAPNEVAVNIIHGGVKTAHGHGFENFDKTQWYDFFINHGTRNTFSSLGEEHAMRRKRVTAIYAKSSIQSSRHVQGILSNLLYSRLLPLLWKSCESGIPLEMLSITFAYGLDFVVAFIFGLSQGINFTLDAEQRQQWLHEYRKSHPSEYMFWLLEHPKLIRCLRKVGVHIVPKWYAEADEEFDKWGLGLVDTTESLVQAGIVEERTISGDMPVVYNHMKVALAAEQKLSAGARFIPSPGQRLELASECLDQIVATRDTFGIVFSFVLLELSRHPYAQQRLRQELRSVAQPIRYPLHKPSPVLPAPEELENLPYLHAILKESIRLRGSLPTPNPRVTPPKTKTSIGPYGNIPPGVRVSAFAWCLHRNENIFPDPEVWIPERWLNLTKEEADMKEKWYWAFGSGSRMCLGKNLAMEMMRFAVAAIYTNFETTLVASEAFGSHGNFITGSKGDNLLMRFTHVD